MGLQLPNLDDTNYDELLNGVFEILPRISNGWTNRNPSDPGIMILEMFAAIIEMDIYQLNRVTNSTYEKFLNLLGVAVNSSHLTPVDGEIEAALVKALKKLEYKRAISEKDILDIVNNYAREIDLEIRAYCCHNIDFTRFDLDPSVAYVPRPGHVTVLMTADNSGGGVSGSPCDDYLVAENTVKRFIPLPSLLHRFKQALLESRILTSKIHLHSPVVKEVKIEVKVVPEKGVDVFVLKNKIRENIYAFYDPVRGGADKEGYAPGIGFKLTEAAEVIEETTGVDYIASLRAQEKTANNWVSLERYLEIHYYEMIWIHEIEIGVIAITDV